MQTIVSNKSVTLIRHRTTRQLLLTANVTTLRPNYVYWIIFRPWVRETATTGWSHFTF